MGLFDQTLPILQQLQQNRVCAEAVRDPTHSQVIHSVDTKPKKDSPDPPYSLRLCESCGEYDFFKDFRVCLRDESEKGYPFLKRSGRLKRKDGYQDCSFEAVCKLCHSRAYLDENETENAYKTRMIVEKVRDLER